MTIMSVRARWVPPADETEKAGCQEKHNIALAWTEDTVSALY